MSYITELTQKSSKGGVTEEHTEVKLLCCNSKTFFYLSLEVHRSSVNAEHRMNVRPNASARFGSATLQHSAELRQNFGIYSVSILHSQCAVCTQVCAPCSLLNCSLESLLNNAPCCTQCIVLQSPFSLWLLSAV